MPFDLIYYSKFRRLSSARANGARIWYIWYMITIDEMGKILDGLAAELPEEFYRELNGGIILLPKVKRNTAGKDLYIMGEYYRGGNMGRYIAIYYGSFEKVYGHLPTERIKTQLKKTLRHEFRHHVESLAGERGLEIEDEEGLAEYLRNRRGRKY